MRPLRIEVEGFAAFRDRAVVDLTGTDLFALVGPTGAGKSTVIDAMVFALYGSVPRYGSKGLVYPVITQGALEARVRLDFSVGDDVYTATRVVRRTKTGASTKEARLEHRDGADVTTVLADDADGLTEAVGALLGLDLEQFTKCVVLPQGAFATLLHDTKATRQDLLVKLLDLGLYERLASAARAETKRAAQRIEFLDEQLARFAHATPEAVAEARGQVDALDSLVADLDDAAPVLAVMTEQAAAAAALISDASRAIETLSGIGVPADVDEVAGTAAEAAAAVVASEAAERAAASLVADAAAVARDLPDAAGLGAVSHDRARLDEISASVEKGTLLVADVDTAIVAVRSRVEAATEKLHDAESARDRARVADVAADLARHLHEGDDCPVCGHEIEMVPAPADVALAAAESAVETEARSVEEALAQLAADEKKEASYRARLEERVAERDQVVARLVAAPSTDEIEAALVRSAEVDAALRRAREDDETARAEATRRRSLADAAAQHVTRARTAFVSARDAVAAMGPPTATDDLAADWGALAQWAERERARFLATRADAERDRADVVARRNGRECALADHAGRAGVDPEPASTLRDRSVAALATERARHAQLGHDVAAAAELRDERSGLDERRQVHDLLAEQLGARGFEAWLLDEALDALLDGASTWLEQLSSGRYAMAVDDRKQFAVIDHANADERRIARTLSGGETFLASLALALALAERVSELSATGGNTLDAIFLDEGFGTLDPDTLDVVATAIEELGATGRMVGIISHVADLADRVPVRFEVTKSPGTSTIERVDT